MPRKRVQVVQMVFEGKVVEAKECTRCKLIKPLAEFHKSPDGSAGGRQPKCKVCKSEIAKKSYTPSENITRLETIIVNSEAIQAKACTVCKITKPLSDFHYRKQGVGNRNHRCKVCQNNQSREWKAKNKHLLQRYEKKRWWLNKEAESERKRRYYDKEKSSKRYKRWSANNADKLRARNMNRVAKKKELPNTLTENELKNILEHFDNRCALTGSIDIELDHFIAIDTGYGGTTKQNIIPLSAELNCSKKNKNPFEWVELTHIRDQVIPEKFNDLIRYLSDLNAMTVEGYREYVYQCYEEGRSV